MEQSTTTTDAATSTLFLGRTGEDWDFWLLITLGIVALAAVLVVVATAGSIISHKREAAESERKLKEFKVSMDGQVSSANERASKADETAAKANEGAATANKAAAEANLKAETEKAERLRLEASLAPRRFMASDVPGLIEKLRSAKDVEIDIVSYEYLEPDIGPLARSIEDILKAVQANVAVFSPFPGSGWARGVVVVTAENSPPEIEELANTIVSSLNSVGIISGRSPSFNASDPISGAYNGPTGLPPRQKLRILIGSKP